MCLAFFKDFVSCAGRRCQTGRNQLLFLPFTVMPSASSKNPSMATQVPSIEGQDPLKVVVSMMEKKIRNLEKRKTKLVSYTEDGKVLVEKDQEDAVKKLELVEHNLELAKEFHNIFKQMEQEHLKLQKKEQKRAKVELKEKNSEERRNLVTQVLEVQSFLENLVDDVKDDFLNGRNGAVKLDEADFQKLDGIYQLISSSESEETTTVSKQVSAAAGHLSNLIDEKDKPILGTTYKEIYGIIKKIKECKYFEKQEDETVREEKETEIEEEEPIEPVKSTAEEASIEPEGAFTSDVRGAEVYQEVPSDHQVPVEPSQAHLSVNGVDLPSEFSEGMADPSLNFMGESEVETRAPPIEEGKLNAASPEFIPRSLQGGAPQDMSGAAPSKEWEEGETAAAGDNQSGEWHDVQQPHQGGRPRGGPRGRDRGGFRGGRDGGRGGRGRGGYGQNGPNHYRQERQDNYRRDSGRGGPRGGNPRGGRGGPRGGSRGGQPRGGGFGRPQQQQ